MLKLYPYINHTFLQQVFFLGTCLMFCCMNVGWGQSYCVPQYTTGPCHSMPDRFKEIHLNGETINFDLIGHNCQSLRDLTNGNTPDLILGNTYTISVKTENDTHDYLGTWIDYGDNGVFGDDNSGITEKIDNRYIVPNVMTEINYTVPLDAVVGIHRVRMRLAYSFSTYLNVDPCSLYNYGQAVDFLIEVIDPCMEPITIIADKDFLCPENDQITLNAEGGFPGVIYFFGEEPLDFDNALQSSQAIVNAPGTYYFRAFDSGENCWSAPKSITITQLEIEIDAGEDQFIGCEEESVQLNASTTSSVDSELLYEAKNTSDFAPWNTFYTTSTNPWDKNSEGNEAGGITPEIKYTYKGGPSTDVDNWIKSPIIDATSYNGDLELSFKHYLYHYLNSYIYSIKVEVSSDNQIWTPYYNIAPTNDIGPQTETINLNTFAGQEFYLRFRLTGQDFGMYYWYIDDIIITGTSNLGGTSYSWSPEEGLDNPNILNPIASPTETTTYTLSVESDCGTLTDTVTVTVDNCLTVLEVCAKDVIIDLNQGLPEDVNPDDVTWYEDDDGSASSTQISDPEDVIPGIYWAFYENEYWHLKVIYDFTGDCLDCVDVTWQVGSNPQTSTSQVFNPANADYGVLDFYEIDKGFKIYFEGANITGGFFYFKSSNQFNVRFLDGTLWGEGGMSVINSLTGEPNKPILRLVFGPLGVEGFYGSKVSADDPNYELEPVELFNGVSFNSNATWYAQEIKIQKAGSLPLSYNFRSVNIAECVEAPYEAFINPHLRNQGL